VRLLVASHDASRTGAPLVLLTFLRWLREETDTEVQLVLWRGGPLVGAFAEVADLTVLHPAPGRRSVAETVELALAKLRLPGLGDRLQAARVRRRLRIGPHDVLYLNGAGAALVVPHLPAGAPTVSHVHELARGLTFSLRGPGRKRFLGADRVIAVARVVADLLVADWGVDRDRIEVVPGCVPDRVPGGPPGPPPPTGDEPLVLSVGAGSWRKGVDRFVDLAATVRDEAGDGVRFAWVGPLDDRPAVEAQVAALGLTGVVDLPGEVADPTRWYERATVFVSTAREDPFPLVALEAGAVGLPVVATDSGGIRELLDEGRGLVVPSKDVDRLAREVAALLADPGRQHRLGDALARSIAVDHRPEPMVARLWAELVAVAAD